MIDPSRFGRAVAFAADRHAGQTRKSTNVPYLAHLLAVASLVLDAGGGEDEAIAALLHDVIEDTGTTAEEIDQRFGSTVRDIVVGCGEKNHDVDDWHTRKTSYLAALRDDDTTEQVLRVSCADKLHNARSILADYRAVHDELWARFHAGKADQLWYYTSLAEIFSERLPGQLASELSYAVAELRREIADNEPPRSVRG